MNSKLKPAIIGGVLVGLLSTIPFVNVVNLCCCLWAILGGAVASYLYIKNSPTPVSVGDGAMVGVIAGVVGGLIYIVLGIPVSILMGSAMTGLMGRMFESLDPAQAEALRQQMEASQTVLGAIVNGLITAVLLVIFSTVGGLLGVPLFEKRKGATPPPPPAM